MSVATTFALSSPWPFVQALWRPRLLFELLVLAYLLILPLVVILEADPLVLWQGIPAGGSVAEQQMYLALCLRSVSMVGATVSLFWYQHLVRLLPSDAVWAYPALAGRLRASVLLLSVMLGVAALGAFGAQLPWPEALALSALAAAWAAWPLLLTLALPGLLRVGLIIASIAIVLWGPPLVFVMSPVALRWLAFVALGLALWGMSAGLAPANIRRVLHRRRPAPEGPAWLSVTDTPPEGSTGLLVTTSAQARAIDRVTRPRLTLPTALPRGLQPVGDAVPWAFGGLIWYMMSMAPSMMLASIATNIPAQAVGTWWPLGRTERLRVGRILTWRGMLWHGGLMVGTYALLLVAEAPRLPFIEQDLLRGGWLEWPLLLALLPFVYPTPSGRGLLSSLGPRMLRAFPAVVLVGVLTAWGQRNDHYALVVGLSAGILVVTLFEQEWRLRRYFLRANLDLRQGA